MASSVGAYQGGMNPPSGSDQPETPPQSGDTDALFSDAETAKEGLWVAYLATNDEYDLLNLVDSVRELWSDADVIEVHQSDTPRGRAYRSRGSQLLTTYGIVDDSYGGYTVLEMANLTPYSVGKQRAIKPRAIAITRPGSKRNEDDESTTKSPSTTTSNNGGCRGRGVAARRSIMARDSIVERDNADTFNDGVMMALSMKISVTVKIGGVKTKQTLGEWLAETEAFIENNCKNFMDVRKLFDFYSTQPEESVETATDESSYKDAAPTRVSMPIGDTNIMIAGVYVQDDPDKPPLGAIYPTYIIREIPQFTLNGSRTYMYTIAKLPKELRSDILSRTRFGLMSYKDDIYYMQSRMSQLTLGSTDLLVTTDDISTALSNTAFDLDDGKEVNKAHFYRLHSTAISENIDRRNTHGIPPLMHPCLYDVSCYDSGDVGENGYITIDLTRNSPVGNEKYTNTPYTTASIIAKFTRDADSIDQTTGEVLYYLRPIHISKVSNEYKEAFGDNYYPYSLTPDLIDGVPLIQIYHCYDVSQTSTIKLQLPVPRSDDYINTIIADMTNTVAKSTPTIVTDYGVQILKPVDLEVDYNHGCIWNTTVNEETMEDWREPDGKHDITVKLEKNEFIVHYGVTFGVTGNVFGLPDPSNDISIDFLTHINSYIRFDSALFDESFGGTLFMFSMFPSIPAHGNPEVAMVLVIDKPQGSNTVTARMYLNNDIFEYHDDLSSESTDREPLLYDEDFRYSRIMGEEFPLTARIIRDICNGNIKGKRAVQFSLMEASLSNVAFHKYLNDLILNYKLDADDSGWDGNVTSLSYNLLHSRWYAGRCMQSRSRSVRRKRCMRTTPGSLYYKR